MPKGFSVPLTPGGKSALATTPPWHYSSDCIAIEYWADPTAVAALLPQGLAPDEKSRGRGFFCLLDWQFARSNDELTDPARYQYRAAFALVDVWAGSAELRIPEVAGEDMHLIAPLRIGRGYRLGMSYSVTDLRVLKDLTNLTR